jgi:hypothetical protein
MELVEVGPIRGCPDEGHSLEATFEAVSGKESFECVDCGAVFIQESWC